MQGFIIPLSRTFGPQDQVLLTLPYVDGLSSATSDTRCTAAIASQPGFVPLGRSRSTFSLRGGAPSPPSSTGVRRARRGTSRWRRLGPEPVTGRAGPHFRFVGALL